MQDDERGPPPTRCAAWAKIAFTDAEASMRLFATEVLPELKSWR